MKLSRIALLLTLMTGLSPAFAQQFPAVPDGSVIGRIGTGGQSGPSQPIPFANLFALYTGIVLPVGDGDIVCFKGTQGQLQDCGANPVLQGGPLGSPSSVGTMPAFTLGGTISGNGHEIDNVNIGNVSPGAGGFTNLFASAVTNLGTTITPQASDVLVLNHNTSSAPVAVNGFSPNFRIIGKDGERPPMSIQGFGVGAEPTILLMHARGTGAAPTASQSGDFIGELFAHPCGAGTTPCTYMHDVGAGFIWRMLENATTTAGEAIDVWTTPLGSTTVAELLTFNATLGGGITFYGTSGAGTILKPSAAASGTLTMPAATDTLVGKATTDTLTNKTLNTGSNTLQYPASSTATSTMVCGAGSLTGGATATWHFWNFGKAVYFNVAGTPTFASCTTSLSAPLPNSWVGATYGQGSAGSNTSNGQLLAGTVFSGGTSLVIFKYDGTFPLASSGQSFNINGTLEIQ